MNCTREEVAFLRELKAMHKEDLEAVAALIAGLVEKDPTAIWALALFDLGRIDAPMALELMRDQPRQ